MLNPLPPNPPRCGLHLQIFVYKLFIILDNKRINVCSWLNVFSLGYFETNAVFILIHAYHLIDAHPSSWSREIMIASGISPIIAHDDASFTRFSRSIQCFLMVMDSKHYWHQVSSGLSEYTAKVRNSTSLPYRSFHRTYYLMTFER